jgi:hypothetical protein
VKGCSEKKNGGGMSRETHATIIPG